MALNGAFVGLGSRPGRDRGLRTTAIERRPCGPKNPYLGAYVPFGSVNAGPFIFSVDSDHDGMPDEVELQNGTNPNDPSDADADPDGDGLTNGDEVALGTNPNSDDSDGDGIDDGTEV